MKYAIVESGGKQFKAVEGEAIDVDRLPGELGEEFDMQRVLLFVDGDNVSVGTPSVSGIEVRASIVKHFRGDKVLAFRYSPKKRIRVHRGARHDFTRLIVEHVGKPGEKKAKAEEMFAEAATQPEVEKEAPASTATKSASAKSSSTKKSSSTATSKAKTTKK